MRLKIVVVVLFFIVVAVFWDQERRVRELQARLEHLETEQLNLFNYVQSRRRTETYGPLEKHEWAYQFPNYNRPKNSPSSASQP